MPERPDLAELQNRLRRLERTFPARGDAPPSAPVTTGAAEVDAALPWGGLPCHGLHEIRGPGGLGFAAALLARILRRRPGRAGLWCRPWGDLHAPGLASLGLDPERLILVRADGDTDRLWTIEEAARSGAPAVVLGETARVPPTAGRRLQLAAERGGLPLLLVRPGSGGADGTIGGTGSDALPPALSRWRADPAPTGRTGWHPRWRLELQRCRGGTRKGGGRWIVEWRHETGDFRVAADVRLRAAESA